MARWPESDEPPADRVERLGDERAARLMAEHSIEGLLALREAQQHFKIRDADVDRAINIAQARWIENTSLTLTEVCDAKPKLWERYGPPPRCEMDTSGMSRGLEL
jgi:hypothetical protein